MTIALLGNQNSGKTTLFNQLTGSNQHVGNFPGVTLECKESNIRLHKHVNLVDLPGIYSLSPYSKEEIVTRDFLFESKPDAIINIVDATNIERNLYLSLQLLELGIPMVIALNMMDEVTASGNHVDTEALSFRLGVPVLPISASKNEGVAELADKAVNVAENAIIPERNDFCQGEVHKAVHAIAHLIEEKTNSAHIPLRFAAAKLVEGDAVLENVLELDTQDKHIITHIVSHMEKAIGMDREAALADSRYSFIEDVCKHSVKKVNITKESARTIKIDSVLTHKYFALPIFFSIMLTIFWLTFTIIGGTLSDWLTLFIDGADKQIAIWLDIWGANEVVRSFVLDGAVAGVGSVLSFLPVIVTLFFFLSILEDSGYMARVAFVMDKLLRKLGLSGKSFVPMLLGFGCSVPAIMSTRTLQSERDRKMTIILVPFMSCSAKLAIYAMFTAAFFPNHRAIVMILLYLIGMLVAILVGVFLKSTKFRGNPVPFLMELPAYRFPHWRNIARNMKDKIVDFTTRAFTVILISSLTIWLLQTFDFRLNIANNPENSMLAFIGGAISPIFAPLGFGNWIASTALISGLVAKETVVSTLSILTDSVKGIWSQASALSFLVFSLLYMPCVAAMAIIRRELNSWRKAIYAMLCQTVVAWIVAFIIYKLSLIIFP